MKRADRTALLNTLKAFEQAALTPEDFATATRTALEWEIILHKHKHELTPGDVNRFQKRADKALNKAMGA